MAAGAALAWPAAAYGADLRIPALVEGGGTRHLKGCYSNLWPSGAIHRVLIPLYSAASGPPQGPAMGGMAPMAHNVPEEPWRPPKVGGRQVVRRVGSRRRGQVVGLASPAW